MDPHRCPKSAAAAAADGARSARRLATGASLGAVGSDWARSIVRRACESGYLPQWTRERICETGEGLRDGCKQFSYREVDPKKPYSYHLL
eukprot:1187596-Prorocentrum_minimum.AAC.2